MRSEAYSLFAPMVRTRFFCLARPKRQHSRSAPGPKVVLSAHQAIVYYAPREEKTWTVHSSCKLLRSKHQLSAGQFYSRGVYTIFRHTRAENTTFPFRSREEMWHFRPRLRLGWQFTRALNWPTLYLPCCVIYNSNEDRPNQKARAHTAKCRF